MQPAQSSQSASSGVRIAHNQAVDLQLHESRKFFCRIIKMQEFILRATRLSINSKFNLRRRERSLIRRFARAQVCQYYNVICY